MLAKGTKGITGHIFVACQTMNQKSLSKQSMFLVQISSFSNRNPYRNLKVKSVMEIWLDSYSKHGKEL